MSTNFRTFPSPSKETLYPISAALATANQLSNLHVKAAERGSEFVCGVHLWDRVQRQQRTWLKYQGQFRDTVLVRPCCHSKTPCLRGWNNRQAFAHSSGVRRSKFSGPAGPVSDESSFWLSGSCRLTVCFPEGQKGRALCCLFI